MKSFAGLYGRSRHREFRSRTQYVFLGLMLLVGTLSPAAIGGSIDFEGLADGTLITNQYPALTFSNAIVLTAGISLNEFEFPPFSGTNVASDSGGPVGISFMSPLSSFAGYFTYAVPLTLTAFDAANNVVAMASSAFTNNMALSGDPGSMPNEFLRVVFSSGISSVKITGNPAGGSFVVDDATAGSGVPEPASKVLVLSGGVILFVLRRGLP